MQIHTGLKELGWTNSRGRLPVLTTPDATNENRLLQGLPPIEYATLSHPNVARNEAGRPRLSATFVLSRMPEASESNIAPLIQQAVLGLDITTAPSGSLLASLSGGETDFRSLFLEELTVKLVNRDRPSQVIAEATSQAGIATLPLSATLDRDDALDLLDTLNNQNNPLGLETVLKFRVAESGESTPFVTDLGQVYTFLDRVAGPDRIFYGLDLQNYLALMIEREIVRPSSVGQPVIPSAEKAKAALPAFLRAAQILFTSANGTEASGDLGPTYKLRQMQIESMTVRFQTELLGGQALKSLDLQSPLHQVLGPALQGQSLDTYVHLVLVDENGRGTIELPRRVKSRQARSGSGPREIPLAATKNAFVPLSLAIRPTSVITPNVATTAMVTPLFYQAAFANMDYAYIDLTGNAPRRLPIVTNQQYGLWHDRVEQSGHLWYAPHFTLAIPTATTPPEQSPFRFTYRVAGHDEQGRPGLEGTIRITLRREIPTEVQSQIDAQGSPKVFPVAITSIYVGLSIPFRDQSGVIRHNQIAASSVEDDGQTVVATINLLDDWVRMSYGSLAFPDFQPGEQAKVVVHYSFEAYQEIRPGSQNPIFYLACGGKSVTVPIDPGNNDINPAAGLLQVDRRTGQLNFGLTELRPLPKSGTKARRMRALPLAFELERPPQSYQLSTLPVIHPPVHMADWVLEPVKKQTYALGSQTRSSELPVLFPCEQFGMLYAEEVAAEQRAIGCQEAFKLGQTQFRILAEVPMGTKNFRVFRSLQVPGQFIVLPKVYAIGRYEPTEGEKAYRPLILLYSTIDVDDLTNSRCIFLSTLQPVLARFERVQLLDELRRNYHPNPTLSYFTELDGEVDIVWGIPNNGGLLRLEAEANRLPDSFQVSFATDVIGVPQLQAIMAASGITGTATVKLPDGTELQTTLQLKLSNITGPWEAGPIEVITTAGSARLINHIQPITNISKLLLIDSGAITSEVMVNSRLETDAEISVSLPTAASQVEPVYSVEPTDTDLTEIRSYIEDIEKNLVFIIKDDLDLAANEISKLRVVARIQGVAEKQQVELTASKKLDQVKFILPLTIYFERPPINIELYATNLSGEERELVKHTWKSSGSLVEIDNKFIGS